jgi:aminoglycoside phosphotransferase (APT) family kinase protein
VKEWTPEIAVDETLARALIADAFPALRVEAIERLGTGWDNAAFLVNRAFVFRFPQRAAAVPLLETELRVLPTLAPQLPLPIPNPLYAGRVSARYPWPFAGYAVVPGVTACRAPLDRIAAALVEPLADFLRALHAVPGARELAPPDRARKLDLSITKERAAARIDEAERTRSLSAISALRSVLDLVPAAATERTAICHGDLYSRHLVLDASNALAGIIDWGDVHAGDPAVDLSIAWILFPARERARFFERYRDASDRERDLARLRALGHSLATLAYALEVGDRDLERACRFALENVAR